MSVGQLMERRLDRLQAPCAPRLCIEYFIPLKRLRSVKAIGHGGGAERMGADERREWQAVL